MHLKYNLFLEGWKSKYNSFVLDLEGYSQLLIILEISPA